MESHVSAGGLGIGLGHLPRLPRLAAAMLAIGGHECIYHLDFVRIPGGGGPTRGEFHGGMFDGWAEEGDSGESVQGR